MAQNESTPLLPRILFSMKKNCKSLLKDINIQRRAQLTPRKALLYNSVRVYKHQNLILKKRYSDAKQRIKIADKYVNSKANSLNGLNQFTQNFIESQMRMQPQKPRGRRFTIDDKVFALSLFKQSGKAYSTLSKVFALPSRKSITDLLKKVPFETGINKKIFEHLKGSVKKLKNELDRFCTVIFDEVSITFPSLQFNESNGKVIGFEDLGQSDRSTKFADKALVFMVRGIRKKFKQPVAFYLTTSNMNGLKLAKIIKEVIEAVQSTGLTVISTVCDQAPTNVAALNRLRQETNTKYMKKEKENRLFGFEINDKEIIPLFDVPHLLKGLRNNLITKDLNFIYDNSQKKASWKNIIQFYEFDKDQSTEGDRLVPKLTDAHVYEEKMKKMKVSHAAQVFSQRVGAIMKRIAVMSNNCTPSELITKYYRILTDLLFVNSIVYLNCFYFFVGIDREAADTGQMCLFVDNLFDSANGNVIKPTPGKDLRSAVTLTSPHWVFWSKALDILRSMKYETTKKIPSNANWITTIQGLQLICKRLLKAGFKYILLRNFNQDPIENFFGSIRSHGLRNINPTPANFISSFKSLVINNFTSTHSVGANCEDDDSDGILDNLKDFLFNEIPLNEENEYEENCTAQHDALTTFPTLEQTGSLINSGSRAYVSGWIIKKIKKITKNCTVCISKLSRPKNPKGTFHYSGSPIHRL